MIPFNRPAHTGNEDEHVAAAMCSKQISGDGDYSRRCQSWFEGALDCNKALLTPSCTHALEMAALLIDIRPGDEVIMPSYTFVSTANAFVLRGASIVFVDIRPDTMNIDENLIEDAITARTRVIVPVHYAGVASDMDRILDIAKRHKLVVVEDAAQGFMATYKKHSLGTLGHLATYSFHETKNITSGGEGGLLIVNDDQYASRAEVIREKGTNRSEFFRGMVDKYSWKDVGSSYLPSELQAAYLWGQLEKAAEITDDRIAIWERYYGGLQPLAAAGSVGLPLVPADCQQNGHMFYLKAKDLDERSRLMEHLLAEGVQAVFHYVPLHNSKAGQKFGRFHGEDQFTSKESERLLRLPVWLGMQQEETDRVIAAVQAFF